MKRNLPTKFFLTSDILSYLNCRNFLYFFSPFAIFFFLSIIIIVFGTIRNTPRQYLFVYIFPLVENYLFSFHLPNNVDDPLRWWITIPYVWNKKNDFFLENKPGEIKSSEQIPIRKKSRNVFFVLASTFIQIFSSSFS